MDDDALPLIGALLLGYAFWSSWGTGNALDLSGYFGGGGGSAGGDGGDAGTVQPSGDGVSYSPQDVLDLATQVLAEMGISDITPQMAAGISLNEDATGDPGATRTEPSGVTSYGLMQVLSTTATWLYGLGYTALGAPTPALLSTAEGSMYFGCAYLHWLRNYEGNVQSDAFVVAAYNGGPGGASGAGPQRYLVAWENNMQSQGWA